MRVPLLALLILVLTRFWDHALAVVSLVVLVAVGFLAARRTWARTVRLWTNRRFISPDRYPLLPWLRLVPIALVVAVSAGSTLAWPGAVLRLFRVPDPDLLTLGVRLLSGLTLAAVSGSLLAVGFVVPLLAARRHLGAAPWAISTLAGVAAAGAVAASGGWFEVPTWWRWSCAVLAGVLVVIAVLTVHLVAAHGRIQALSTDRVEAALRARDRWPDAVTEKDLALAWAMTIAAVPGLSSLAEATVPPFHKNVLTLRAHRDGASTVVVLRGYGIDDEAAAGAGPYRLDDLAPVDPDDPPLGFFLLDEVRIHYDPSR